MSLTKNCQNSHLIMTVEHMIQNYIVNGINPITCDTTPIPALTEYSIETEAVVDESEDYDSDEEEDRYDEYSEDEVKTETEYSIDERNITFRIRRTRKCDLVENYVGDDISSIESDKDDDDDSSWNSDDE